MCKHTVFSLLEKLSSLEAVRSFSVSFIFHFVPQISHRLTSSPGFSIIKSFSSRKYLLEYFFFFVSMFVDFLFLNVSIIYDF